jgi:aminopeptidase YwaD
VAKQCAAGLPQGFAPPFLAVLIPRLILAIVLSRRLILLVLLPYCLAIAQQPPPPAWTVKPEWVRAHEDFLASDALQGRGSATRDEHIAAAYIGSRFEAYGLQPATGMKDYVQAVELVKPDLDGKSTLNTANTSFQEGTDYELLMSSGESASGPLQKLALTDVGNVKVNPGAVVLLTGTSDAGARMLGVARSITGSGARVVLFAKSPAAQQIFQQQFGGKTRIFVRLKGSAGESMSNPINIVALTADVMNKLSAINEGETITLALHRTPTPQRFTYNALGWLPGRDPASGTILLTAHLDHLGIGKPKNGDAIYNGADDDAAGTTAVLELAHALASGPKLKRSVLFVCFGSEEQGGFGADFFRSHPPVPLPQIIANLEFEMIGAQDPKMPKGTLLLTGWERSNLGPTLAQHGAKLGPDPYPEQEFFRRSDNYALALKGVVAHTAAGWGTPPYYHQPDDDLAHLDFNFMTEAIQSLIEPVRWLANSDFKPQWNPGGDPSQPTANKAK